MKRSKRVTLFLFIFAALYVASGCTKDPEGGGEKVGVDKSELRFNRLGTDENGGKLTFTVTSNVYWAARIAEADQSWLSLSVTVAPAGETPVTVTLAENPAAVQRTAEIILVTNDLTQTSIRIIQAGTDEAVVYLNDGFRVESSSEVAVGVYTPSPGGVCAPETTYSGSEAYVGVGNPSSGYAGASGGANVRLAGENAEFIINGMKTFSGTSFNLSYAVYAEGSYSTDDLRVEVSGNGSDWAALNAVSGGGTSLTGWNLLDAPFDLAVASEALYVKFVSLSGAGFRIDDIAVSEGDGTGGKIYFETKWDGVSYTALQFTGTTAAITRASELAWLAAAVNGEPGITLPEGHDDRKFTGYTFTLLVDLDLNNSAWTPIGYSATEYFSGIFDGNGKTVSNLNVDASGTYAGLFGNIRYNEAPTGVRGLTVTGNVRSGASSTGYAGGIVGYALGSSSYQMDISDCRFYGSIELAANAGYAGGIAAVATYTDITRCEFDGGAAGGIKATGNTTGTTHLGGICGFHTGSTKITISGCTSSGNITTTGAAKNGSAGGIISAIGTAATTPQIIIRECVSSIDITADKLIRSSGDVAVGGIIGYINNPNASISSCANRGNVSAISVSVGGIAGFTRSAAITACANSGTIANIYAGDNNGSANNDHYAGGICGRTYAGTLSITACHNSGAVNNSSTVNNASAGGIIGHCGGILANGLTISACYNTGVVAKPANSVNYGGIYATIAYGASGSSSVAQCYVESLTGRDTESANITVFGAAPSWPTDQPSVNWGVATGEAGNGYWWKSLGTPGSTNYPLLWWE